MDELSIEVKECIKNLTQKTVFLESELVKFYHKIDSGMQLWRVDSKLEYFERLVKVAMQYYSVLPICDDAYDRFINLVQRLDAKEQQEREAANERWQQYYYSAKQDEFKGVIDFALLSIKSIMATNAGAIIALLTFLQTIWKDDTSVRSVVLTGLCFFVSGLVLSVLVSFFAYLAQYDFHHEEDSALLYRKLTIISGFLSLGCFVIGSGYVFIRFLF